MELYIACNARSVITWSKLKDIYTDPSHQEASIAGPDLLPIVFVADAGTSVVTYLAAASDHALRSQCADAVTGDA